MPKEKNPGELNSCSQLLALKLMQEISAISANPPAAIVPKGKGSARAMHDFPCSSIEQRKAWPTASIWMKQNRSRLERPPCRRFFKPTDAASQFPIEISGRQAWESQVVAWFWQSYASSSKFDDSVVESSQGTSVWLYRAVEVAHPIPVLNQALLALSTARYGRVSGNLDITKYGQRVYGIALRLLQDALYDEVSMLSDETLASVRALVLYEVFEATSNDYTAWYRHVAGQVRLMQSRGPRMYTSPIVRTILEDVRYTLMLKAIMMGKSSPFGERDWIELPWEGRTKPPEQRLSDFGFKLASLIEQANDLVALEAVVGDTIDQTITLLESCHELQTDLESFPATLSQSSSGGRSWLQFEKLPSTTLTDTDVNQLTTAINLWTCKLILGWIADPVKERLISALELRRIALNRRELTRRLCATAGLYADERTLADLAHAILRYLPLCVGEGTSDFAASRTLCPITCVVWQLRYDKEHLPEAWELMKQISGRRKIRFKTEYSVMSLIPAIARDEGGLVTAAAEEIDKIGWLFQT